MDTQNSLGVGLGVIVLTLLLDTASQWWLHFHHPTPSHSYICTSLFVNVRQHLISHFDKLRYYLYCGSLDLCASHTRIVLLMFD